MKFGSHDLLKDLTFTKPISRPPSISLRALPQEKKKKKKKKIFKRSERRLFAGRILHNQRRFWTGCE